MVSLKRLQLPLRGCVLCFGTLMVIGLASCGSDSTTPVGVSVTSSASSNAAVLAGSSDTATAVTLTPAFTTSIHDYVISCGGTVNINVSFTLPGNLSLGLTEPDGTAVAPVTYPTGQFSQVMAISPGQRFQFTLSGQSENYSVRCTPTDLPPITASFVTGNEIQILVNGHSPLPQAQWYVYTPNAYLEPTSSEPTAYVVITDAHGTPVWWKSEPLGAAVDAMVLNANEIAWTVTGLGAFYIRDFDGNLINTLTGGPGGLDAHELQVTPSGTFLAIKDVTRVCPSDCADMSPWGGSAASPVIDAEILELDSHSNVLWTWRTRDHIALSETGTQPWFPSVGTDIIHMNAIEPVGNDALMFSARHLDAIYHVTKSTGNIDWKLGGEPRAESLTVVGETRATALGTTGQVLSGQHDVRLWSDGTVSVHDNGTMANRPPYVVRWQIDTTSKTAEVVEEFTDSRVPYSVCCGSARRLNNGHWVMNWGSQPFFTEMVDGVPVLTLKYSTNGAFSYRSLPVQTGIVSAETLRDGMDAMAAGGT